MINKNLKGIFPVYIQGKGDCTKIYTERGEVYKTGRSIRTVIRNLCKHHLIDLQAVNEIYGDKLCMKNLVPIPFDKKNVFVYVKVREPKCKNDSAFGLVNIRYIKDVKEFNDEVSIIFDDNTSIKCLSSYETVKKHIKNGQLVSELQGINLTMDVAKRMKWDEVLIECMRISIARIGEEFLKQTWAIFSKLEIIDMSQTGFEEMNMGERRFKSDKARYEKIDTNKAKLEAEEQED